MVTKPNITPVLLARALLKEAGHPELVPFIGEPKPPKPGRLDHRDSHFVYHGGNRDPETGLHLMPYTIHRVHALGMAWHLVHVTFCADRPTCLGEEMDAANWIDHGAITNTAEFFHTPPDFWRSYDVFLAWADPCEID